MMPILRSTIRTIIILLDNCIAIPAHTAWLLLLQPLYFLFPAAYWFIEGVLFKWLLFVVTSWIYSAGYKIVEFGDDLKCCEDDRAIVIANHQTTADVPVMMCFSGARRSVPQNLMWVMDGLFRYTNFGWVSVCHKDAFIWQGKDIREKELAKFRRHISTVYRPLERKWLVLFPEGGFLYKRLESSQRYAKKHNYPVLNNVTLPRVGAMQAILEEMTSDGGKDGHHYSPLKWIIDLTVAYPKDSPLDFVAIVTGSRQSCVTSIHCRKYAVSGVPMDEKGLQEWMYARYAEKDRLLDNFYRTGQFESLEAKDASSGRPIELSTWWVIAVRVFFVCSFYFHCCWMRRVFDLLF